MNKAISSLSALALVIGLAVACTDSSRDRVGENPPGDRTPTAQPVTPADNAGGAGTTSPGGGAGTASGSRTN